MKIENINKDEKPLLRDADLPIGMKSLVIENRSDNTITMEFDTRKMKKNIKLKLCKPNADFNILHEYAKYIIKGVENDNKQKQAIIGIGLNIGIAALSVIASYTICKDFSEGLSVVAILSGMNACREVGRLETLIQDKTMIECDKAYYSNDVEVKTEYTKVIEYTK